VIARTEELAVIAAPTGSEQARAARVGDWWRGDGLAEVHTDAAGSLWARVRDGDGPATVARSAAPSAVHGAIALAAEILRRLPAMDDTSVNIGRIGGRAAINARARECSFDIDLRAVQPETLEQREAAVHDALRAWRAGPASTGLEVAVTDLGRRPAGEIPPDAALVRAAETALRRAGRTVQLVAASTDANAAGVPALAIGVTTGAGEHTEQEWIDLADLPVGLAVLADTVSGLDGLRA
jgi:acetylornithine deacetylase/succinyl-diaminopimelate desuccinylase-like protein